ncbi:hypothetical protein C8Q74DRAFT_1287144 [Fomes fomentarius]|nr:hypothetical protein C8Q74DRAFT_1287144 [Fomes fomentarius]
MGFTPAPLPPLADLSALTKAFAARRTSLVSAPVASSSTSLHSPILDVERQWCSVCQAFVVKDRQHYMASSKHPKCIVCSEPFENSEKLQQHYARAREGCDICKIHLDSAQGVRDHYRESPRHPSCNICGLGFKNADAYDLHLARCSMTVLGAPGTLQPTVVAPIKTNASSATPKAPNSPAPSSQTVANTTTNRTTPLSDPLTSRTDESRIGPDVEKWVTNVEQSRNAPSASSSFPSVKGRSSPDRAPSVVVDSTNNDVKHTNGGNGKAHSLVSRQGDARGAEAPVRSSNFPTVYLEECDRAGTTQHSTSPSVNKQGVRTGTRDYGVTSNPVSSRLSSARWDSAPGSGTILSQDGKPRILSPPSWQCRLCRRDPCDDIVATFCGHIFCHDCIVEKLATSLTGCPVCNTTFLVKLDVAVAIES